MSFGVQDLDDTVQRAIGRVQPLVLVEEVCTEARRAGFTEINLDLIYGLPPQTMQSVNATLDAVVAVDPDRLRPVGRLGGAAHVGPQIVSHVERLFRCDAERVQRRRDARFERELRHLKNMCAGCSLNADVVQIPLVKACQRRDRKERDAEFVRRRGCSLHHCASA